MPFIRSFIELMITTEARDEPKNKKLKSNAFKVVEDSGQRKRYLRSIQGNKEV